MARVTAEIENENNEKEFTLAAWLGWQNYLVQPKNEGARVMTFKEWMKFVGLKDPVKKQNQKEIDEDKKKRELEKARQATDKVVDMFSRKKVRKMHTKK